MVIEDITEWNYHNDNLISSIEVTGGGIHFGVARSESQAKGVVDSPHHAHCFAAGRATQITGQPQLTATNTIRVNRFYGNSPFSR